MVIFHSETYVFFVLDTWGQPRRPPGPLDGPDMFLEHCGLVRGCVGSSGDAVGVPTGCRRRLLDLKARRTKALSGSAGERTQDLLPGWLAEHRPSSLSGRTGGDYGLAGPRERRLMTKRTT